jgi:hypothetical protein
MIVIFIDLGSLLKSNAASRQRATLQQSIFYDLLSHINKYSFVSFRRGALGVAAMVVSLYLRTCEVLRMWLLLMVSLNSQVP